MIFRNRLIIFAVLAFNFAYGAIAECPRLPLAAQVENQLTPENKEAFLTVERLMFGERNYKVASDFLSSKLDWNSLNNYERNAALKYKAATQVHLGDRDAGMKTVEYALSLRRAPVEEDIKLFDSLLYHYQKTGNDAGATRVLNLWISCGGDRNGLLERASKEHFLRPQL